MLTVMLRLTILFLLLIPQLVFSQTSDHPFQVLVAEGSTIFGKPVEPLMYVDDVTSIEVQENGFLSLVHKGGTTYELKEKVFTFYLKQEKLKDLSARPELEILYETTPRVDDSEMIVMLNPPFDSLRVVNWIEGEPIEIALAFTERTSSSLQAHCLGSQQQKDSRFWNKENQFPSEALQFWTSGG